MTQRHTEQPTTPTLLLDPASDQLKAAVDDHCFRSTPPKTPPAGFAGVCLSCCLLIIEMDRYYPCSH